MSEFRYEDESWDGHTRSLRQFLPDDPNLPRPEDHKFFFSLSLGEMGYVDSEGKWVLCKGKYPRYIGRICVKILQALMLCPGRYLSADQIAAKTNHAALRDPGALAARIHKIRKALGHNFVETSRIDSYRIRWPMGQAWLWREVIECVD